MIKHHVVGLDLSLRNAAAVWIPHRWKPGKWDGLKSWTAGYGVEGTDPRKRVERLHAIASEFAEWLGPLGAQEPDCDIHVYVEDYAYGLAAQRGVMIAELGGAVKVTLFRYGYVVKPINQSTARKYLLGKLPPKDRATAVHVALKKMGTPYESCDENDAFVIASYGRTEHGLPGLTLGDG